MLKLKVKDQSLCVLQVYAPNAVSKYLGIVDVYPFRRLQGKSLSTTTSVKDSTGNILRDEKETLSC